eukprot:CAMPEP_0174697228 /NCGR_PEP_ID=MMETSP1094-20130205/3148_1 /TAXON_ID=156173 /ORGANISM="Chrysochromulina brevifilum, Strain UTEX LB 985" /LENGTH=78 /DNA_ID=CAMNT_0015894161 /DNA_START=171 /DNA_END=407 /DNA_ORIENTATION=+
MSHSGSNAGKRPHEGNHTLNHEAKARRDGLPAEIGTEGGGKEHRNSLGGADQEWLVDQEPHAHREGPRKEEHLAIRCL